MTSVKSAHSVVTIRHAVNESQTVRRVKARKCESGGSGVFLPIFFECGDVVSTNGS